MINNIVVIGIGGIGSHLLFPLLQFIKGKDFFNRVVLVDGDKFEEKNHNRQFVPQIGVNKASSTARYYENLGFDDILAIPEYINTENIKRTIHENDVVFLCVDNNATRKLIDEYVRSMNNVVLISGGNELYDGNVQIVVMENGFNIMPSLVSVHPEINTPEDKNPDDLSCEELSRASQPQISIVNAGIADIMRRVFFGLIYDGVSYHEVYVNFKNGNIRNVKVEKSFKIKMETEMCDHNPDVF